MAREGRPSELAELLKREEEAMVSRWEEKVQPPVGKEEFQADLVSSIPTFLQDIAKFLEEPVKESEDSTEYLSGEHGRHRFEVGFDLKEVIREYEALLEVIVEEIQEQSPKVELIAWQRLYLWIFTAIKEAVAAYSRARDKELDQQASEYLAFLAHELRNSLTSVTLALHLLERKLGDGDHKELSVMATNLSRVMDLIDSQLLELRMRSGTMSLQVEEVGIEQVFRAAVEALESNARTKGQRLAVSLEEGLVLQGDRRLLRSILLNLLGNAIKFSPAGATIRLLGYRDSRSIIFSVRDQCGGLPEGLAERMFDPFVQLGRFKTGHGLGLAIVKQATESHEGTVRVHNHPGEFCEMIVDLPIGGPAIGIDR